MLIDSHAHLTCESCLPHVDSMLASAKEAGVGHVINICTNPDALEKGIELKKKYPNVHNVGSTTPHDVEKEGEAFFDYFANQARSGNLVAVGETGLDYYYEHSSKQVQQEFLQRYLLLAKECKLPVVIHCREAFKDVFRILDMCYVVEGRHLPGVLHCFTGTLNEAQEVCERGWYLSLSGIITYKKSQEIRDVVKKMPLEKLFVETDSPYLTPQSNRGRFPNQPANLVEIVSKIAEIKELPFETVAHQTAQNARTLFQI